MSTLVIIAKEPLPGKVKTRLHPPLSLEQAARVAAAIADTLHAMADVPAERRILLFDGELRPPGSEGYELIAQATGTLDLRLAAIFDSLEGPTILIGMDTPQVRAADLAPAFEPWTTDALFGPATDGGFWALGLRRPRGDLVRGVTMSTKRTGADQLRRLTEAGLAVGILPTLDDVDTFDDALRVAAIAPTTQFARTLGALA